LQVSDLPRDIPRLGAFRNSAYRSTSLFHIAKGIWGLFLIHKEAREVAGGGKEEKHIHRFKVNHII